MISSACLLFLCSCDRSSEFKAQAQKGQPIIQAIESYQKENGRLPSSLNELSPKFIAPITDLPNSAAHKFNGWDYSLVTNDTRVSYNLKYYMGKGGVAYEPPNWIGNDEGTKTTLFSNP